MGGGGFILGGALQGIGAGLVARGQEQAEATKSEAARRREMALARYRNSLDVQRDNNNSQNRMSEAEHGARQDDWKSARQTARTTSSQITIAQVKAKIDSDMARLQSRLNMNEAQAKAATDLANQIAMAGKETGHEEVAADGSLVFFSKTGAELGRTAPGTFTPKQSGSSSLGEAAFPEVRTPPANRPSLDSFNR